MGRYILAHCPRCGMDSGERKTFDGPEEKYLVICTTCGLHGMASNAVCGKQ